MFKFKLSIVQWLLSILVPIIFLVLIEMIISVKQTQINKNLENNAYEYGELLIKRINQELNPLVYLSKGIEAYITVSSEKVDSVEIQALLKQIKKDSKIIRNLVISEGTVLKFVEPLKGNETVVGVDYKTVPDQWPLIKEIIRTKKDVLTGPVDLIQGGRALIYRKPIYQEDHFWGVLSIVIDVNKLFKVSFEKLPKSNYSFSIRLSSEKPNSNILYGKEKVFESEKAIIIKDSIPDGKWEYAILPTTYPPVYESFNMFLWVLRVFIIVLIIILLFYNQLNLKNKKSEANYRLLANNLSNIIWIFDIKEEKIKYITPSVLEYLGYTFSEVLGSSLILDEFLFRNTLDRNETIEKINSLITNNSSTKSLVLEYEFKHKQGHFLWCQTEFKIIKNNKKEAIELLGNTQIIHDRKIIENQLRESETRLRAIVNTTLIGVSIVDSEGYFQFTNSNSQKIHAYSSQELQYKAFCEILFPDDIELFNNEIQKLVSEMVQYVDFEIRILHKLTNKIIWIHISANIYSKTLNDSNKNILILYQDVTKQKRYEDELKTLNKTKDQFLSVLAHDLKSPFSGILGFLTYLIENFEELDRNKIKELLESVNRTSQNTYLLLENLLLWARTQQQKVSFQPEEIKLRDLVDNNISLLLFTAENKKIDINNNIGKDFIIRADIEMLNTIFRNLISNALKYTNLGGEISINLFEKQKIYEFQIIDNGIGMNEQLKEKLFNFNTTKSKPGTSGEQGTGFGLVICKDFVELHKGKIWFESEENKGTTFYFTIAKQL